MSHAHCLKKCLLSLTLTRRNRTGPLLKSNSNLAGRSGMLTPVGLLPSPATFNPILGCILLRCGPTSTYLCTQAHYVRSMQVLVIANLRSSVCYCMLYPRLNQVGYSNRSCQAVGVLVRIPLLLLLTQHFFLRHHADGGTRLIILRRVSFASGQFPLF